MRQAMIAAPDRFEVTEAAVPDGALVLRTLACGICSGDLMPWYLAKKVGTVFGHEPVGRAVKVDPSLTHVKEGDLVFVHHHAPCLNCDECRRGAHVHCATWKRTRLAPGGMAEYLAVSREMALNDCFAVNDLSPEEALFIEPLACCAKAFARCGPVRGTVIVVGCGVMGLLNVQAARASGAAEVIAVEPNEYRRRVALEMGADSAVAPGEALRHRGDVVMIGPGFPDVIRAALEYVRPAGVACLFTPTATGVVTPLDLGELYFREVSVVPSYSCGPLDTRRAYDWIRSKAVTPQRLITHRFRLEEIQAAYDAARGGGAVIKAVVVFPEG